MKAFVNNGQDQTVVITKTPMRITLGGGGTDVYWYSKLKEGAWISAAINRYVYVFINKTDDPNKLKIFDGNSYYIIDDINKIDNLIVKECLKTANIKKGIQITTISEVSSRSGLGGSGSFEVGLLNALYHLKRKNVDKLKLAQQATDIEASKLKMSVGPQDQYIAAIGGINYFEIDKNGRVTSQKLKISQKTIQDLQANLLYFSTDIQRDANSVLGDARKKAKNLNNSKVIYALDRIKELGQNVKMNLEKGHVDAFGEALHTHWQIKKSLSTKISNDQIDTWYKLGIENGALGGKIIGAGGGGWFMFYVNKGHSRFKNKMQEKGLIPQEVSFDWEGAKILN